MNPIPDFRRKIAFHLRQQTWNHQSYLLHFFPNEKEKNISWREDGKVWTVNRDCPVVWSLTG